MMICQGGRSPSMKKILILEANPRKDLSLNDEIRDLQNVIRQSPDREKFQIDIGLSVRSSDLHQLILEHEPNIVHFCGHGTGQDGLVFLDKKISTDTISNLFEICKEHLECVVLNACYSEVQADEINKHIKYVIGINQAIRDDAAMAFSIGFYRALGYGRSFEDAFKFGKNAIQLAIEDSSKNRGIIAEEVRKLVPIDDVAEANITQEHLKPILKINSNNLTVSKRSRPSFSRLLEQELEDLQEPYDLLREKLKRLREARAIAVMPDMQFALDKKIKDTKQELNELQLKIEEIEQQLS